MEQLFSMNPATPRYQELKHLERALERPGNADIIRKLQWIAEMERSSKPSEVCALETIIDSPRGIESSQFTSQLVELMMRGAKSPGFWSAELISPLDDSRGKWRLVQRFNTEHEAKSWQSSATREELVNSLPALAPDAIARVENLITHAVDSDVSTAIITEVRPEMKEEYFKWVARIQSAQVRHPGYRSIYLQPPVPGRENQWSTLLRFDSPSSMDDWFESDVRKQLVTEATELIEKQRIHQVFGAFPGWIPTDAAGNSPPNWKTALLVLLGLFPIVMLQLMFVAPLMQHMEPTIRTFINLVGSVACTSFITMPAFVSWFKWWLYPAKSAKGATLKGSLLLILLFIAEILVFVLWTRV